MDLLLVGITRNDTMKVVGTLSGKMITILIDSGTSDNSISFEILQWLALTKKKKTIPVKCLQAMDTK